MRFRNRRSAFDIRQFSTDIQLVANAGASNITDTVMFSPAAYTASASNTHLVKDFTVQISEWMSDVVITSGVPTTNFAILYEYLYLADQNTTAGSIYLGSAFSGAQEVGGADPRVVPDRVLFRRMCILNTLTTNGARASDSWNWYPRRRTVKARVKVSQALFWRSELLNQSAQTLTTAWVAFAAVAIKANG